MHATFTVIGKNLQSFEPTKFEETKTFARAMEKEPRAAKLAKLDGFRRSLPFMTASALAAVLEKAKTNSLPSACSKKYIRDAIKQCLFDRGYGEMILTVPVTCKNGTTRDLVMANPLALLQAAYQQGGSYYELVQSTLQSKPSDLDSCWNAIFYMDEVQPGNQLGIHQGRKCWVLYFSMEEYGPVHLQKEACWLTLLVERTAKVQELHAGVSQVFAAVMRYFFANPTWDVKSGLLLKGPPGGVDAKLHIQLGSVLQDGGAHKAVFHVKGDAATRLCFICYNLVAERSQLVDGDNQLTCKLVNRKDLCMATDHDIKQTINRIKENKDKMCAEDFKVFQQATGFNYEPFGLLFSEDLQHHIRPVQQFVHDWMHCLVSQGVFQTICTAWLDSAQQHLDIYKELHEYLALWIHPKTKKLSNLFSPKRKMSNKEAGIFKCDASEALSLGPILCFYLQKTFIPAGLLLAESNVS